MHALSGGLIAGTAIALAAPAAAGVPAAMILVGGVGMVVSVTDFIQTVQIMKNETGLTPCIGTRLLLDVAGTVLSAVSVTEGVRAWRASGSLLSLESNSPLPRELEEINWPPNRGFLGEPKRTTLMPGTRVDRYGSEFGHFVSPEGTPYEMISLAPGTDLEPYTIYEVIKPV